MCMTLRKGRERNILNDKKISEKTSSVFEPILQIVLIQIARIAQNISAIISTQTHTRP